HDLLGNRPAGDVDLSDSQEGGVVYAHQLFEDPLVTRPECCDHGGVVHSATVTRAPSARRWRHEGNRGSSRQGGLDPPRGRPDAVYYERGINLLHGYLTEYYVEDSSFVFPLPETLREVGVLLEPTTVAEKGINHAYEIQRRLKVWEPRRALILGSGTIGLLMAMAARLRGLELTVASLPQPPYRNSELVEQLGGVYVSTEDKSIVEISKERGPFDLIMDATGFSP